MSSQTAEKVCAVGLWAGSRFVPQTWDSYLICRDPSQPGLLGFLSGQRSPSTGNRTAPSQEFFPFPSPRGALLFKRGEDRALFESCRDCVSGSPKKCLHNLKLCGKRNIA